MVEELIKLYRFEFVRRSRWSKIYENDTHVLIQEIGTQDIKIKPLANRERNQEHND